VDNKPEEIHCSKNVTEIQLWEVNSKLRRMNGELARHDKAMDDIRKTMAALEKDVKDLLSMV